MRAGALLLAALVASGCLGSAELETETSGDAGPEIPFVPGVKVGDQLTYEFEFSSGGGFAFRGTSLLDIVAHTSIPDAYGNPREALHVRSGNPGSAFTEEFWVDAKTLQQFKLKRGTSYNETSRFPASPLSPVPVRQTMYANASGTLERFLANPLFEDFNYFGAFASGQALPPAGTLNITGNFYRRNATSLLGARQVEGHISESPESNKTFGPLSTVHAVVDHTDASGFQKFEWVGKFSASVPLAVDIVRNIEAKFGTFESRNTFSAKLTAYKAGTGPEHTRELEPLSPGARLGREGFTRAPPDGAGLAIRFPLSEALAALGQHPVASQFFQTHANAYLAFAHLDEQDTCRFFPQNPYPGCHWLNWFGVINNGGTSRAQLVWRAEKYASGDGTGVSLVPILSRDLPFEILFDLLDGDVPEVPPEQMVFVRDASQDLLPRSAFPADTFTLAGAVNVWKATADEGNRNRVPNFIGLFLTPTGYSYYLDHYEWVFPTHPELFVLYDRGALTLSRHPLSMGADGRVVETRNYDPKIEQR